MTAGHTQVLAAAVLHVVETNMGEAEVRIRYQCRIRAHLQKCNQYSRKNDDKTPDTVPKKGKEGKRDGQ